MGVLYSHLLTLLGGVEHGFGTRESILPQDRFATLRQIHSARCLVPEREGNAGEGDALITNRAGLAVSVRTADCLPILLADPVRRAVAAIHAGWRGTAAQIVPEAMRKMEQDFGTQPRDVIAAIGPGIGVCCYEVGADVGRQFGLDGAGHVNLAHENRRQLVRAGVAEAQIDVLGLCTFCDDRFYSWRRDKERAGRMVSFIRLTETLQAVTPKRRRSAPAKFAYDD